MATAGNKGKAAALFAGLHVERLVGAPFSRFVGYTMNVFGNWWPGTKGKEANKEYEVQVMAVDEHYIPSDSGPGTKGSIHFQVALVDKSDPHSTRTTTQLVEKHNYWWVTNSAFSAAYFAHKARTDQAAAHLISMYEIGRRIVIAVTGSKTRPGPAQNPVRPGRARPGFRLQVQTRPGPVGRAWLLKRDPARFGWSGLAF